MACCTKYYSITSGGEEQSSLVLLVGCCTNYYSVPREGAVISTTVLLVEMQL